MNVALVVLMSIIVVLALTVLVYALSREFLTRATRYAVTLKNDEGAFIALCTRKRWGTWTFEDVKITPPNPGGAYRAAAPGRLYVPTSNILYYQQITETANVHQ